MPSPALLAALAPGASSSTAVLQYRQSPVKNKFFGQTRHPIGVSLRGTARLEGKKYAFAHDVKYSVCGQGRIGGGIK